MLPLGVLSIIQAVFLPGMLAGYLVKNVRWVDRVLLAVPLSLAINYILVLFLTLTGLYGRSAMFCIVGAELLLLLVIALNKFFSPNMNVHIEGLSLVKPLNFRPMELCLGALVLVSLALFNNEAWHQLGTGFMLWDSVVSWNRWAVTWYYGELPHSTWQYPYASQTYPQGIPILYSLTYQFIANPNVQFFAKAIAIVMPFAALATFFRMAFLVKTARNILLLSVPIFIMLLAKGSGNNNPDFMFSGYVDPVIAYFGVLVCYVFALLFIRKASVSTNHFDDHFIYLAVIVVAATALIKQTGVIAAFLFPLAWFYYMGRHMGTRGRIRLFLLYLIVALLAGHWYVYKAVQIYQGVDVSFLSEYNSYLPKKLYWRPFSAFGMIFNTYGWLWLVPFVMGFRVPAIRALAIWGILPIFLFWAFFVSYDLRGLYLAMPWIAILWSAGCYNLYEIAKKGKTSSVFVVGWLVAFLIELKGKLGTFLQFTAEFSIQVFLLSVICLLMINLMFRAYAYFQNRFAARKVALLSVTILGLVAATWCVWFSSDETSQVLINKSIEGQRAIGNPELNQYLLKRLSEDGGSGYFATSYQLSGFIPGLRERFKLAQCGDFSFLAEPAVRYYLHAPSCPLITRGELEKKMGGGNIEVLRENSDHYVFYEIHR